jgi:DNA mismatch endonuclease (patch repair protein)
MSRVRHSGTACELTFRAALHREGYRYRLRGGRGLPGTPDLVLARFKTAIFVDGCFWHGCPKHGTMPKSNTKFWRAKILRNVARDKQVDRSLARLGWKVMRVWEHEIRFNMPHLLSKVERLIARPHRRPK